MKSKIMESLIPLLIIIYQIVKQANAKSYGSLSLGIIALVFCIIAIIYEIANEKGKTSIPKKLFERNLMVTLLLIVIIYIIFFTVNEFRAKLYDGVCYGIISILLCLISIVYEFLKEKGKVSVSSKLFYRIIFGIIILLFIIGIVVKTMSYILVAYSIFGFFIFLLGLFRVIAKEKGITIIPPKVLKRIVIIIIISSAVIIFIIQLIQVLQGKIELPTNIAHF